MSPYPSLRVVLEGREPFEVQTRFKDMIATERALHAEGMPGAAEAPLSWSARLAWHAGRRSGDVDVRMPYEAFEDALAGVEVVEDGDGREAASHPPEAGRGSSAP